MNIGIDKLVYVLEIFKRNNKKTFTTIIGHLDFDEINDVTQATTEIVGRNKLVLKTKSSVEFMNYTMDDE